MATETAANKGVTGRDLKEDLLKYKSVKRITRIPVVETSYQYVASVYSKVKSFNRLISWGLGSVEGTVLLAVDKTLPTVLSLNTPLSIVDSIICKGLDTVEHTIPAITYPPQLLVHMSKDYVSSNLIQPVLKRADSVKQLGITEATRVGELAATRLDSALDIADNLVDKYLPDSSDNTDSGSSKKEESTPVAGPSQSATSSKVENAESATTHAIHHMNRLGKKLQRRITKRTLMEAQALKKGGSELIQALIYLTDLLVRDPKGFVDQMASAWARLSEDEPENQVPPANLEQVIALIMRETARRVVHTTNFLVATLPAQSAHMVRLVIHHSEMYANYALKIVHLEGAKNAGVASVNGYLEQLRNLAIRVLEASSSRFKETSTKSEAAIPLLPISDGSSSDANANTSVQNVPVPPQLPQSVLSQTSPTTSTPTGKVTPKYVDSKTDEEKIVNGSPKTPTGQQSPELVTPASSPVPT